ncbi:X-linked retinitis pigmentosa GTPase regulator [Chionoecetes opilio]|uniref:X-linked retinitis pigmentosa GTPase regulator n=1 Tax=Chionoecetes opilio TaxID=41210 RepID=A0A8J8WM80_CHIOP|nr:X-linked retinitis pigmentosa GTPase regulator [Chionoecetes opilio]
MIRHSNWGCGQAYTWGESDHGKLGLGDGLLAFHRHPQEVTVPERVVQVAAGTTHTLLLTENGVMYACGLGNNGELGLGGEEAEVWLPRPLMEASGGKAVIAIAAGANHSSALTGDGHLLTWGCGRHGKLCQGEENFAAQATPMTVRRLRHIRAVLVGCGGCHTMVLGLRRGGEEQQEEAREGGQEVQLSSASARSRRRLFNGVLPPLKSSGLPPLKHVVLPTVPDAEDPDHPGMEAEGPDTAEANGNDNVVEVEWNREKPAGNFMSESESEDSVVEVSPQHPGNSPSPEKKSGRLARFFSSLRGKKPSPAPPEDLTDGDENGAASGDSSSSPEGHTHQGSVVSVGENVVKEAFVTDGDASATPEDAANHRQSKACIIL